MMTLCSNSDCALRDIYRSDREDHRKLIMQIIYSTHKSSLLQSIYTFSNYIEFLIHDEYIYYVYRNIYLSAINISAI